MAEIDYNALNSYVAKRDAVSSGGGSSALDLGAFLKSSMDSVGEMVGFDPSLETERYRAENPGLGLASELLPGALTYGGWWKLSTKVPAFARALGAIGGSGSTPVLSGAAREMARYAPLELGRIAGTAATNPDKTWGQVKESLFNEATAGVLGGVGGLLHAGGPRVPPIPEISSEVNLADAIPLQLRALKRASADGNVASPEGAEFWTERLRKQVLEETPDGPHVAPLEGSEKLPKELNRLFQGGNAVSIDRRRLIPQAWEPEQLAQTMKDSGIEGYEDLVQFPRYVSPLNQKGANEVYHAIGTHLQSAGDGVWFSKEADDGLYVVAKRFDRGAELDPGIIEPTDTTVVGPRPRKPDLAPGAREGRDKIKRSGGNPKEKGDTRPGDKWLLFKTDQPERWVPPGTEWQDKLVRTGAWHTVDYTAPTGTMLNNVLQKTKELVGFRNFKDAKADPNSWLAGAKKRLGVGPLQGEAGQAAKQAYDFVKEYMAPSTWQFLDSPRASYLFNVAKSVFDAGKSNANRLMFGEQRLGKDYSLLKNIVAGVGAKQEPGRPAINTLIEGLYNNPKDVFDAWRAQLGGWDQPTIRKAVLKGEINPATEEFLNHLNQVDAEQFAELVKTQESFGLPTSKALPGHRMISNTFKGSIRIPVYNEKGNLVALASGADRAEARSEAEFLLQGAKVEGKNWTKGYKDQEWFTSDYSTDIHSILEGGGQHIVRAGVNDQSLARALRERYFRNRKPPSTMKVRTGVEGYVGGEVPWTKQELKDILESHLRRYQNYMAELNVKNGLEKQMKALAAENPRLSTQLSERIADMAGRPGAFSQMQNQLVDKVLAPYLGKDSASKIVSSVNRVVHHFQLGMGNISFPILNALTFMQTVVPQVAFITKASREDLAKYYGWALTMGSDGLPRPGIGFLQLPRIMAQSFRELGKPTEEMVSMMSRGIRDMVLDPKIIEEFAGQNSSTISKMGEALQSPGGFVKWIESVSNFLPAASERLSRSHAFSTGYVLGRDFFNLKDEALYSFTKTFTERTMFGYGVVDRAKVLSGPLGNLTGLYKNWQMHYMGWLLEYMNQASKGNMAPLAWSMLGTTAVGGVAASPFYFVADAASRMFANKSAMQMVYDNFGPADKGSTMVSDAIYYGLPAFAGVSLQGSAAAPGANPVRDASMLFSLVQWQRAVALKDAIGASIDEYGDTGRHPVQSREVRDKLIQALAPKSVHRIAQAVEDGMIRSLNTNNSLAEATPTERVLYGLGLNPIQVAKQMDVSTELYNNQQALQSKVKVFGADWAEAETRGDWRGLQTLMLRAMADGVPLDSIQNSAKARKGKAEQDSLSRRFKAEEINKYTSIIGRR